MSKPNLVISHRKGIFHAHPTNCARSGLRKKLAAYVHEDRAIARKHTFTNSRSFIGRFTTSISHAFSAVIGSKQIRLNSTGGRFLTASKHFRHGATSKSRRNTGSNSTTHKSPHLSGWRKIISLIP